MESANGSQENFYVKKITPPVEIRSTSLRDKLPLTETTRANISCSKVNIVNVILCIFYYNDIEHMLWLMLFLDQVIWFLHGYVQKLFFFMLKISMFFGV